ncbi:MAG: acyltransferase family protein [Hyphomonadaceae bacterium]
MSPSLTSRRADLDWLRVSAFALLILYHVGLVFAPWDWHVHSHHRIWELRYPALALNPWRLALLFLISGAALRLMSRKLAPAQSLKARLARLAPPFAFGVVVLVPPQSWIEAVDKGRWHDGLVRWWISEFSPAGLADGAPLNHLWFVLYIGAYSLAAIALMARPALMTAAQRVLERTLTGWRLFLLPMAYLVLCRDLMFGWFGVSNRLTDDWYNHAVSLPLFLLGFLLADSARVWRDFEAMRRTFLAVAALALAPLMALELNQSTPAFYAKATLFGIYQWAAIGAAIGYAGRYLRDADGPALRYLREAVFPCYLAHQTILVIAAQALKPARLPIFVEAPLLLGATIAGSLLVYEIVRRLAPIRVLWGLRPAPITPRGESAPATAAAR